MKEMKVKVKDKIQFEIVINLMLKSGRKFSPYGTAASSGEDYADKVYDKFPYPMINEYDRISATCSTDLTHSWPEDSTEIINTLFQKTYEVENVGDYKATITKAGIVVGCQTIPFEKFDEIVAKVAEFKADQ